MSNRYPAVVRDTVEGPAKLLLVDRANQREDRQAVELQIRVTAIFDELREPVIRYLACLGIRATDADEIVQETFLRFFRFMRGGGSIENVRGWVFRVAHNTALNYMRDADPVEPLPPDWSEQPVHASGPNPEELLLQDEQRRRLYSALSTLSLQQRQCLYLRVEGFGYREIGEILGLSISTVVGYQRRAMKKLIEEVHG